MADSPPERMSSPLKRREIRLRGFDRGYVAILQPSGRWWIGWIDEIAGVNSQAETREEWIENPGSALEEALEEALEMR